MLSSLIINKNLFERIRLKIQKTDNKINYYNNLSYVGKIKNLFRLLDDLDKPVYQRWKIKMENNDKMDKIIKLKIFFFDSF